MRKRLLILIVLLLPSSLYAWHATGHMTVALIAYRQLSENQQAQIGELLKHHPHYQLYLTDQTPPNVETAEWAFLRAACWPDFVRPARPGNKRAKFQPPAVTRYHQSSWHYIDMPYYTPTYDAKGSSTRSAGSNTRPSGSTTQPAADTANIVTALAENMGKLSSDASPDEKAVALAWVEHLIGDIHQPLHAASLYSKEFPKGDMGGNDQAIIGEGGVTNLHSWWDELLGTTSIDYEPLAYSVVDTLATQIAAEEAQFLRQPQFTQHTTAASWAQESHNYAITFAYLDGRLQSAHFRDYESKKIPAADVPPLPQGYAANARDLAKLRVALAAQRLAETLKTVFKD
jgi:hypothetical protein